ncbi:hypothetical protein [Adlercreutzia muris]|uniref:Uncharacterized protein n=1 Tax=Adlercreutzia muris TaxID=1796610 RepID=A0A7C8FWT7_9ACTN|nr:hypothetical protein [Adlercreutzia muris]KAB1647960.1 hypothetical protein F8D48_06620 [Adlercreutzia muris]MCR2027750.1 hypothetical protein [Adlercreutzia muris]
MKLADSKPLSVASTLCSILGFPLALLSLAGVQMPWILDAIGNSAFIWLPIVTLITGFLAFTKLIFRFPLRIAKL